MGPLRRVALVTRSHVLSDAGGRALISRPSVIICPSWQWHRAGYRLSPVRTLPMAPLWCLGPDKAAANLSLRMGLLIVTVVRHHFLLFICIFVCSSFHCRRAFQCSDRSSGKGCRVVPQSLREELLFLWSFIASKVLLQFSCLSSTYNLGSRF